MRWNIFRNARCGKPVRYKNLVFWACEGLVVCQDERPGKDGKGTWQADPPATLEQRVKALGAGLRKVRGANYYAGSTQRSWIRQDATELERALNSLLDVIKEARNMGDPTDPAVQAFWQRHRRSGTITLSSRQKRSPVEDLPDLDLGPVTGRTAREDAVLPVDQSRDFKLHVPPRRRQAPQLITADF
jgi:hypothetical protein